MKLSSGIDEGKASWPENISMKYGAEPKRANRTQASLDRMQKAVGRFLITIVILLTVGHPDCHVSWFLKSWSCRQDDVPSVCAFGQRAHRARQDGLKAFTILYCALNGLGTWKLYNMLLILITRFTLSICGTLKLFQY